MLNEAGLSPVKMLSEAPVSRRADPNRATAGKPEGPARPETFGAMVSEKAQARGAEVPEGPRPQHASEARDRRPPVDARAEGRRPASADRDTRAPAAKRPDKSENAASPGDEKSGSVAGPVQQEEEKPTVCAGETTDASSGHCAGEGDVSGGPQIEPFQLIDIVVTGELLPAELPGQPLVDVTGGTSALPQGELPVIAPVGPVVQGVVEAEVLAAANPGVVTVVAKQTGEGTANGVVINNLAEVETTAAGVLTPKAGAIALDALKAAGSSGVKVSGTADTTSETPAAPEGESTEALKVEVALKKPLVPDLNPTRLSRFADMLEGFGSAHALHRPADILAGLDRTVQAGALNRHVEVSRPTPLQMLPIEIGMQAVRGVTNFQIRLDPAELGRVDVRLQIRDNGEVNASLVVDRVETLAMLKRDASTLQYAFEQAGLKQSADGLTFSLRGDNQNGQGEREARGPARHQHDESGLQADLGEIAMRRSHIPNSSLDLMI